MTLKCPQCEAELIEPVQYCTHCGAFVGAPEQEQDEPVDRFKILVAALIAIVSLVGALIAWRISVASGNASQADVSGLVSTINRNQAYVASEADMYRNLRTYLEVRIHSLVSNSLFQEYEQYPSGDPNRTRLWDEAWTEIFVAEEYLEQVDIAPEYIRPDGSYDGQAAQGIDIAHRSLNTDFDFQGRHFTQADRMRNKVQWLIGMELILSAALLFYTMAEVISQRIKYVFFALGSVIFVLVLVTFSWLELTLV